MTWHEPVSVPRCFVTPYDALACEFADFGGVCGWGTPGWLMAVTIAVAASVTAPTNLSVLGFVGDVVLPVISGMFGAVT